MKDLHAARDSQNGMTLIELMIVVVIVGIVFQGWHISMQWKEERVFTQYVDEVSAFVATTRREAALCNASYSLICEQTSSGSQLKRCRGAVVEEILHAPSHIKISIPGKEGQIAFSRDMSPSPAGTLEIVDSQSGRDAELTVAVATGKITLK